MKRPTDAYREGYNKGRSDNSGGILAEATMGMLHDDPGGHFAAGYHDGAAGNKFNPPSDNVRKPVAELNPFDDKVAIKTVCPNCGDIDWFEWKFLGRLKDPVCDHTWYIGSGTYLLMQVRASFGFGYKCSKYLTSGISGQGAWIAKFSGWFIGTILGIGIRLEFGILMIPFQAVAGLCQSRKSNAEIVSRSVVIGVFVAALSFLAYEVLDASRRPRPFSTVLVSPPKGGGTVRTGGSKIASLPDVSEGAPIRPFAQASSTLRPDPGHRYDAENVLDGRLDTVWAEGVPGYGEGEWIQVVFPDQKKVSAIEIFPGHGKSQRLFQMNGRPRVVRVEFGDNIAHFEPSQARDIVLEDTMKWQQFPIVPAVPSFTVRFTIVNVFRGTKYEDTAISELRIH